MKAAARGRLLDWAPLAAALALFLFAGTRQLDRPALGEDEAVDAVMGMELALGLPRTPTDWSLDFGGAPLPLRNQHPYDFSAFHIYWSALAFSAAGVSVETLRAAALIPAACVVAALYALCLPFLGRLGASSAALLLGMHPAFLLYARQGFYAAEVALAAPTLAAAALAALWARSGSGAALCGAGFLLGASLNVSTKALAPALAYPVALWAAFRGRAFPSPRLLAVAAACAALGAANFLAFNALRGGLIASSLLGAFAAPTFTGVDNLAPGANLLLRGAQLLRLMSGADPAAAVGTLAVDAAFPALVALSFAGLALRLRSPAPFAARPLARFALTAAPLMLLMTLFTPKGLDPQHLLVLWPSLALAGACGLSVLAEAVERRRPGLGASTAAAALLAAALSALRVDAAYFDRLESDGAEGSRSPAVYELARRLDGAGGPAPVSLDWGLTSTVSLITSGRVRPDAFRGHRREPGPWMDERLHAAAAAPSARFLSRADGETRGAGGQLTYLRGLLARDGRGLELEAEVADGAGRPVYQVWRVAPASRKARP